MTTLVSAYVGWVSGGLSLKFGNFSWVRSGVMAHWPTLFFTSFWNMASMCLLTGASWDTVCTTLIELAKQEANSGRNFKCFGWRLPLGTVGSTLFGLHFFHKIKIFRISKKQKSGLFFGVLSTTNEFRNHFQNTSFRAHRSTAWNVSSRKTLQRPKQHPTYEEFWKNWWHVTRVIQ